MDRRTKAMSPDQEPLSWWRRSPAFVSEMATHLHGKKVLEIFAGNGLLAHDLTRHGVEIRATSLFMSHDWHEHGFHHPVVEMDAVTAVETLGDDHDVLLASWPVVSHAMLQAAQVWGSTKPILYIGEMPRAELGMAGLPGCASDEFFEAVTVVHEFTAYERRSGLDRAVVLHIGC